MRLAPLLVLLLGNGCYRSHMRPVDRDAAPADAARDAGTDAGLDAGVDAQLPTCMPGEPCDCFNGGHADWSDVSVCVRDDGLSSPSLGGECSSAASTWGSEVQLRARCPGTYRFCASVTPFDSSCSVIDACTEGRIDHPGGGARLLPPRGWFRSDACALATADQGGTICGRVEWTSDDGQTGMRNIDCLGFCGQSTMGCGVCLTCNHIGGGF